MENEKRIYVVIPETIQVPLYPNSDRPGIRTVLQPAGRQIAQACHVVNELRLHMAMGDNPGDAFDTITTIILQARNSAEMGHVYDLLSAKKLSPVLFGDENERAYGVGRYPTALAVYASPMKVHHILDYLPLWG